MAGILIVGGIALAAKPTPRPGRDRSDRSFKDWARDHYTSIVAGAMAYGYYVGAALLAGAEFPKFLRDHLFDGLAPAALVGILIDLYPRTNPAEAYPKIRRPVIILLIYFVTGAVVFGLIGAAAVFSSGENDYTRTVQYAAWFGGLIFPAAYIANVTTPDYTSPHDTFRGKTRWDRTKWWFTKRTKPGTTSEVTEQPEPHVVSHKGPAEAGSKSVMRRPGPGDDGAVDAKLPADGADTQGAG